MSTLTSELKASILAERIVKRVLAAKAKLPKNIYRRLTERIASLNEEEKQDQYFTDPAEIERIANFGINPATRHSYDCLCDRCQGILGKAGA